MCGSQAKGSVSVCRGLHWGLAELPAQPCAPEAQAKGAWALLPLCFESFRRVCGAEESWTREELPTGTNEPCTQAELPSVRL